MLVLLHVVVVDEAEQVQLRVEDLRRAVRELLLRQIVLDDQPSQLLRDLLRVREGLRVNLVQEVFQ